MKNSGDWLQEFVGAKVEVIYTAGYKDIGIVHGLNQGWIQLQKSADNEILLIPTTGVRIVRLMDSAPSPDKTLLRPAGGAE